MKPPRLNAALAYLKRGWSVLPLNGKKPYIPWEEFQKRLPTEKEVTDWFNCWPNANVGIVCGPVSGLLVLDVDPRNNGLTSLVQLKEEGNAIPTTVTVRTGGGGEHYYFTCPGEVRKVTGFRPGLDLQAAGSYIVAPPSIHPDTKKPYEFFPDASPSKREIAAPPAWLLEAEQKEEEAEEVDPLKDVRDGVGEGRRNDAAARVAGYWLRTLGDSPEARRELETWNRRNIPPLDPDELEEVWNSVRKTDKRNGHTFQFTDTGNAERLVARFGGILRFVPKWNRWLIWDGTRWRVDELGEIQRFAKETVRAIYQESSRSEDGVAAKIAKHAIRSEGESPRRNLISLARAEAGIPLAAERLDSDPWLLNLRNGTLDLRTGELRPHRALDLITRRVDIDLDLSARAPRWEAFLAEIMAPHPELIPYLQRVAGYALTGSTREEVMFILYGTGANGKSKFLESMRACLGPFCAQTPTETLLVKKEGGIPNDLARLQGIRLVTAVETEDGKRLAEARVKALTGGDTITARFLHQEFFEFIPQFKIFLAVNHKPVVRGTDPGLWRRIHLIPFSVTIPEEQRDRELLEKLRSELPGILAWAVRGCLEWARDGLKPPETVLTATKAYKDEMDVVGDFIEEKCVVSSQASVSAENLRRAFEEWSKANDVPRLSHRYLAARWKERGATPARGGAGTRIWRGIGLREGEPETGVPV
jgi:putative DNA primase/helicase